MKKTTKKKTKELIDEEQIKRLAEAMKGIETRPKFKIITCPNVNLIVTESDNPEVEGGDIYSIEFDRQTEQHYLLCLTDSARHSKD